MVGLGRHARIDELRYAYEQAMAHATRSGDMQHAVALSRAFDELSGVQRGRVYDHRVQTGRPQARSTSPVGVPARKPSRSGRAGRVLRRVVAYGLLVPAIVAAAVLVAVHTGIGLADQRSPNVPTPAARTVAPAAVLPKAPRAAVQVGPTVAIPMTARTGANGLATVLCQPGPGLAGYYMTAPPGSLVACVNGATPYVLR